MGDFRLELKSLSARKKMGDEAERSRTRAGQVETDFVDVIEKSQQESEGGIEGLKAWLSGLCVVS